MIQNLSTNYKGTFNMTQEEYELVEELEMLKDGRVKQDGKKVAELCKKGSMIKVGGDDKVLLLSTGMAKVKAKKV
jgi:hypothetical protein